MILLFILLILIRKGRNPLATCVFRLVVVGTSSVQTIISSIRCLLHALSFLPLLLFLLILLYNCNLMKNVTKITLILLQLSCNIFRIIPAVPVTIDWSYGSGNWLALITTYLYEWRSFQGLLASRSALFLCQEQLSSLELPPSGNLSSPESRVSC